MAKSEFIKIQVGDQVIELIGADKEAFIAQREADQVEHDARVEVEDLAKTQRQTKLDSAITKLKALGLTEAEAKVVIGIE